MTDNMYTGEGNNGGDILTIKEMTEDTVHLELGHCCVMMADQVVPVEFITAALTRIIIDHGSIEGFLRQIGWPEEMTDKLIQKVQGVR